MAHRQTFKRPQVFDVTSAVEEGLRRVPDYTVIVLHPERFAWSQINNTSNETSTQVPDIGRGMLASLATPSE